MSLDRQEESIYKPMRELAYLLGTVLEQFFTSPESAMKMLWDILTDREKWFSVGGVLFIFIILLLLVGVAWSARWAFAWLRGWWLSRIDRDLQRRQLIVAFYERFSQLMRSRGLKRKATQTQREFAQEVTVTLASELSSGGHSRCTRLDFRNILSRAVWRRGTLKRRTRSTGKRLGGIGETPGTPSISQSPKRNRRSGFELTQDPQTLRLNRRFETSSAAYGAP